MAIKYNVVLMIFCFLMSVSVQASELGTVDFPTSTNSPAAQGHFVKGVAALHSFWYEKARDEFREASKIDPGFAMAYWGEGMTYNTPLWQAPPDIEAAQKVLSKIKSDFNLTARERAYIEAVKTLYGQGEKPMRDYAYSEAMEKIFILYPDDNEAATFYALSLLGSTTPLEPSNVRIRMRAAAIAAEIWKKEPNHPGAVHYFIHALDDPDHAVLALPAAKHYAQIAPDSFHALHMPSHIFLQLGMWQETTSSNEIAWASSVKWVANENLSAIMRDFHSLHWLLYSYLQQGRFGKADETLRLIHKNMAEFRKEDEHIPKGAIEHVNMAAAFIIDTERWDFAEIELSFVAKKKSKAYSVPIPGHCNSSYGVDNSSAIFALGLAAAKKGLPEAKKSIEALKALRKSDMPNTMFAEKILEIQELEIAATLDATKKDFSKAIKTMERATKLEADMQLPSGPPEIIKPSNELFGEILLAAKRPEEGSRQFDLSLSRHPNRMRSLLGAARAAAALGIKDEAAIFYGQLLQQFEQADAELPEKAEAREFFDINKMSAIRSNHVHPL